MYQWTQTGDLHARDNRPNEDALFFAENDGYIAFALADGVGSCRQSKRGAQLAAQTAANLLLRNGALFMEFGLSKVSAFVFAQLRHALRQEAGDSPVSDYASTLTCCLLSKTDGRALVVNLGDSLPLAVRGDQVLAALPACSSRSGISSTIDDDSSSIRVRRMERDEYDDIVLCSDGAWRHWFFRGQMLPTVQQLIARGDYSALAQWTSAKNPSDDSSFIAVTREYTF